MAMMKSEEYSIEARELCGGDHLGICTLALRCNHVNVLV